MSRRERVGGTPGTAIASLLQPRSPWGAAAITTVSATAADSPEHQATEVAAFALSPLPSPAADGPTKGPTDQLSNDEHRGSTTAAPAGGVAVVQVTAGQDVQQGPAAGLLETAEQLQPPKEINLLLTQQHKVDAKQPQQKHKKGTADIHLIGEITGAFGFGSEPLHCTWQLVYDAQLWSVTMGFDKGRTHASCPLLPEDGGLTGVVWEAPIDLALTTTSMQHWPVLVFKLFHRSVWLGRDEFVGYSVCTLPNTPGCHHISCPVWAAVEAHRSFKQEITSWFTGLTPQLVDESFITDLEQRYEQGQHLHTRDCSSSTLSIAGSSYALMPVTIPTAKAVECIGGAAVHPGLYCRSFGTAGAGGTAAAGSTADAAAAGGLQGAGGRICLRLHLLARGLQELKLSGGENIGACLERLRDNLEKMRRHKDLAATTEEEAESEGVRLVREGRAARLAAVQQQLDGSSNRGQLNSTRAEYGSSRDGSFSAGRVSRAGRLSPSRNTLRFQSRDGLAGTSSLMTTGRFTSRDGDGADAAAGNSSSPVHYSRAGRFGGSPGRAAATLPVDDAQGPVSTGTANTDSYGNPAAWRPGSIMAGTDRVSGSTEPTGTRAISASSAGAHVSSATSSLRGGHQAGQFATSLLKSRGANASPTEQQGLWSGGRSAPVSAESAGDGCNGGAAAAEGSYSGGPGLLSRRGAQLQPLSQGGRRWVSGAAADAGSPGGSDTGGAAPLLPYGADSSSTTSS